MVGGPERPARQVARPFRGRVERLGALGQPRVQPRLVSTGGVVVDDALAGHLVDERHGFFERRFGGGDIFAVEGSADCLERGSQARPILPVALAVLQTLPVRFERGCMRSHVTSTLRNH